ncbi:cysteine desulfurase [Candidatus Kaiserbacteria bacterium]|nr:cysteine desulfurase [Candidatus Kaiserbacteria bacterium]
MFDWFKKKPERIYLDYASATPVCEAAALAAAKAAATFGNPGSIHAEGVQAKRTLENARESIAAELGCKAHEVVFTSGGTEANNLAILGFARKLVMSGPSGRSDLPGLEGQTFQNSLAGTHWVVSSIEHPSVLECFVEIERLGGEVAHVDPDIHGIITPEAVSFALRPNTVFVSIGWGNSEIGTIQPLAQTARVIRDFEKTRYITSQNSEVTPPSSRSLHNIVFHTDAGQASLYQPLQVHSLGVDLLSLDSGKLYGPRGIGALFVGKDVELAPIILGGKQERRLRAGTENVALAAGFAAALTYAASERASESKRLEKLRDHFAREMIAHVSGVAINGSLEHAMPHILNISIPDINSEYVTLALDHEGIALSTKSACREGEASRSHVVEALGGEPWRAQNTLRFSLGRSTNAEDLKRVVHVLASRIESNKA